MVANMLNADKFAKSWLNADKCEQMRIKTEKGVL